MPNLRAEASGRNLSSQVIYRIGMEVLTMKECSAPGRIITGILVDVLPSSRIEAVADLNSFAIYGPAPIEAGSGSERELRRDYMGSYYRTSIAIWFAAFLTAILLAVQTLVGAATIPLKVLRVGADPDYRPTSWTEKSGKMVGSDVDFATALASHMGVSLHYEGVAWDGIIPALLAHKIDAITAMVITDKRKEVVAFSRAHSFQTITTVVRAASPANFKPGKADLSRLKVGVMVSTSAAQALENIPGVKPTIYNTVADEYNDLILGRIDVVVIESVNAGYTVKTIYPGKLRVTNKDLTGQPSYTGVALRKEDTQLRKEVDAAINTMIKDGSLKRIWRKWYGDVNMIPGQ